MLVVMAALPTMANSRGGGDLSRPMAHCMLAKMKANQRESYRDALKSCKQQLAPSGTPQPAVAMNGAAGAAPSKP